MKSKIFFLIILGLAVVQVSGCSKKSFDPALADSFFPLRPGLSWTYRIVDRQRGTTQILADRVMGAARFRTSDKAIEVESTYSGPAGAFSSSVVYVPDHGYFARQARTDRGLEVTSERAFLPQLLKPDLSWSNSFVPFEGQADIFHITQTHRTFFDSNTIQVPAGQFSGCIRIETEALYRSTYETNPPLRLRYIDWYAPHIGLVKTIVLRSGWLGSEIARIELINFAYAQVANTASLTKPAGSISLQRGSDSRAMR